MAKARAEWMAGQSQLDLSRLVFIDEAGAKTNMTRLRGRALQGSRLFAFAPHGHWCTTTMISAIRLNGKTAAMEVEGASDGPVFREYVRVVLAPSLSPGDIVVMDNLRTHYDAEAIRLIEACSASVKFLPIIGKNPHRKEFFTCGGVRLKDVDFQTMESRLVPGLYLAGEVLDIAALTGGFNLQAAWTTGTQAARALQD